MKPLKLPCLHICIILFTLLMLPAQAIACACCGLEGWWDTRTEKLAGYNQEIYANLVLSDGYLTDDPGDQYSEEIKAISQSENTVSFKTELGSFIFTHKGIFDHRLNDISFVSQPERDIDDDTTMLDIYHEWVFKGWLQLPPQAPTITDKKRVAATLVIQGLGNMCFEGNTFKRWILSVENSVVRARGLVRAR